MKWRRFSNTLEDGYYWCYDPDDLPSLRMAIMCVYAKHLRLLTKDDDDYKCEYPSESQYQWLNRCFVMGPLHAPIKPLVERGEEICQA